MGWGHVGAHRRQNEIDKIRVRSLNSPCPYGATNFPVQPLARRSNAQRFC